jgi:hypothetical protein
MELVHLQLIFLGSLFLVTLGGAIWPLLWLKWKVRESTEDNNIQMSTNNVGKILSYGNSVACGAFLAMCFLHLVPQMEHKWKTVLGNMSSTSDIMDNSQEHHEFPMGPLLLLVSFTMMFFIENYLDQRSRSEPYDDKVTPTIILTRVGHIRRIR